LNLFAGGAQHPPQGTATPGGGFNSSALDLAASSYNSGAGASVNHRFRWQAEPINNNSNNASGTLNLLFSVGNNPLTETGLSIAGNGQITFAGGQTFPGSVSTVTAGDSSITIGGTASAPTVAVANAGITNGKLANPSLTVAAGAGLTGGGSVALGGTTTLSIGNAGVTNTMLQNPSVTVNTGSGLTGGGTVALGGTLSLSNAGVLSVGASAPLASSGGANPSISLTGTVPIANGGTGITTAPASAGQFLRSSGAGTWAVGNVQAGDLPSLSGSYVDLVSNQSIAGNKTFTQAANVTVGNGVANALVSTASDPNATAVLGQATDTTVAGAGIGVAGTTSSPGGIAVVGTASDTTAAGFTTGVLGRIAGPNGFAINGVAVDTTGTGFVIGVRGVAKGPSGNGVRGVAQNAAGTGGVFTNISAGCSASSTCHLLSAQTSPDNGNTFTDAFRVLGTGAVQAAAYQDLSGNPIPAGTVTSVTSGDSSIAIGGSAAAPTVAVAGGGITNAKLAANSVTNSNIADASLAPAKIAGTAATLGPNSFNGNQSITGNLTVSGSVTGGSFSGNGSGLTNLNAGNLSSGTVPATALTGTYNINISGNAANATNAAQLGGTVAANYARQDIANNFFGVQNFGTNASIALVRFNDGTTGTILNRLAKLSVGGAAIITTAGDTEGALGIVVVGAGTAGQAQIAVAGAATCNFDSGTQTGGNYVTISATTAGQCHDAGPSLPMGTQVIGRVGFTSGSPNNTVFLFGPEHSSTNVTAADNTITVGGTPFVPALSVNGANVTGVNAAQLGGLGPSSYAQLAGSNSFTGVSNTFTSASILPTVSLRSNGAGNTLVGFNGGGPIYTFDNSGNETLTTNGGNVYLGNAGCSASFTGVGFGNSGMTGCANFSLLGNGADTVVNRPTGGSIFFRENNVTQMSIAPGGPVTINNGVVVNSSVNSNGSGIKHARAVFGSVTANGGNGFAFFWPTPFADANYTVTATVEETDGAFFPLLVFLSNRLANSIFVNVKNNDSVNHSCVVHIIAMHD
jgi:hypothetical protein